MKATKAAVIRAASSRKQKAVGRRRGAVTISRTTAERYRTALDDLYNYDEHVRKAVIKIFGLHHANDMLIALGEL